MDARGQQLMAAKLMALLADDPDAAAGMVAAGAVPRLVSRQPSAAHHLAAIDGVAEVMVQLLASHSAASRLGTR
jgi:hypothetical protein